MSRHFEKNVAKFTSDKHRKYWREKIPGIIAQYEERTAKLKADVPQLEAIISKSWGKEEGLT